MVEAAVLFSLISPALSKFKHICLQWPFLTLTVADQSTRDLATQRLW